MTNERKATYIKIISTGTILPFSIDQIAELYDIGETYVIFFNDGSEKLIRGTF
jgi:hypothetical protein